MKSKFLLLLALSAVTYVAHAQEAAKTVDPSLVITGSVDTYYKYDFSGHSNIPTSFASDQNSFSIGMVDLGLKKKIGKASFVGEVSFGPRNDQSIPVPTNHIQNLYVAYDLTSQLSVTAGYMSTFVGYEVISPAGNFNYSTSYLFTNGPFQNAGVKLSYAFSDKVSLAAGLYNDLWNVYSAASKINTFGAQLMVAPVKGWTAYLNLVSGPASGTELDLTTTYQITEAFKLGLNAADFSAPTAVKGGFTGVALYPQVAVAPTVTLGLRGEYFKTKTGGFTTAGPAVGESVTGLTFTANIKGGPLTFIPEVRLDNGSKTMFTDNKGIATKSASQFALAAVYAF
ncbi:porin [Mucilaginibacter mali]|uniref:Porin n=1 Tax=Mucilaginibacter mali TaxID=2740462 RepID=A0A7D4UFC1_9SPHI|nr:porin [Mucilaginibacter mali]QKJ30216.1 porin [Mucilaginibacter mali]